jgi:hypothetical protein
VPDGLRNRQAARRVRAVHRAGRGPDGSGRKHRSGC